VTTPHRRPLSNVGGPVRTRGRADIAAVLAQALRATETADRDSLTHGFHTYPARMHRAIPATLVSELGRPGQLVLDPFCGSGTVLLEAMAAGRDAVGVDISPLALRIARVKCELRDGASRERFVASLRAVAQASEQRVRARVPVKADLGPRDRQWYSGHVLKELAGLLEEIRKVELEPDRQALEMVFSAIVVKFSRQRADTSQEQTKKRIRKGLATEFFERKGRELVERWAALEAAVPATGRARIYEGDARNLDRVLPRRMRTPLVITSPPYGGTYDYAELIARRCAWLGISVERMRQKELGARRDLRKDTDAAAWDQQLVAALAAMSRVTTPRAILVLLLGDGQAGSRRLPADEQVGRLVESAGLGVLASASQRRLDRLGGRPRSEHLIALTRM